MGEGDSQPEGKDDAFWNALTTHVPNLHAVVSGHGEDSVATLFFLSN